MIRRYRERVTQPGNQRLRCHVCTNVIVLPAGYRCAAGDEWYCPECDTWHTHEGDGAIGPVTLQ